MVLFRPLNPTMFSYFLRDSVIVGCDKFVMDLDFKLTSNIYPSPYIEYIRCKAFKMFIMRLAKDLRLKSSPKVLYFTFV